MTSGCARSHASTAKCARVMKQVGFEGDLAAFFDFMRTDAQFYYPDSEEGRAAWIADAEKHIARNAREVS